MNPILIADALEVLAQIVPLIQSALANNQTTISAEDWTAAIESRDAALVKLDADIAAKSDIS